MMLRTLCLIWSCKIVLGVIIIRKFTEPKNEFEVDFIEPPELQSERKVSILTILKSKEFWQIFFISFTFKFYGQYVYGSFKTLGARGIPDDAFLSMIGSVGALSASLGRIFWTTMMDYFSFKSIYWILFVIQVVTNILIEPMVYYKWIYGVIVSLSVMTEGCMGSICVALSLKVFGPRRGAEVFSYLFASFGTQSILGSFFVSAFQYDIGYTGMFIIALCITLISGILVYNFDEDHKFDYHNALEEQHHHAKLYALKSLT